MSAKPDSALLQSELIRWSTWHAGVVALAATATALLSLPLWLLSLTGAVSFAALFYRCRNRWTPERRFGVANAVTAVRIAGILAMPALPPGPLAGAWALALFALDGLDGRLARRHGLMGPFGEFADKEGDAFLVLMLCLLLYRLPAGIAPWILVPGLLRYAFVLFVAVARPPLAQEVRTRMGAWIAGLTTASLVAALAAYPGYLQYALAPVAVMTIVLCCSFIASTVRLYGASVGTK